MKHNAFTLTEILITLAIIGVVATMTIPTLVAKINKIVTDNQTKVFKAKIIKGLNLTKTAGDLNDTYTSTYDFLVSGLGKNLKMAKICNSEHIRDCVPYNKISYLKNENEEKTINVSELTASKLKLDDRQFKDIAAFVLADGTPAIVSYNLKCIDDPDKADTGINSCLAGIYDLNGTRKPNKMAKDLMAFNGAGIDGAILASVGGVKIVSNAQVYDGISTSTYCDTTDSDETKWTVKPEYSKYGITMCCTRDSCQDSTKGDRWAAAMIACQDMGAKLPTMKQLADIASELYGTTVQGKTTEGTLNSSKIPSPISGFSTSDFSLWSSSEKNQSYAYRRYFKSSITGIDESYRNNSNSTFAAVCVTD